MRTKDKARKPSYKESCYTPERWLDHPTSRRLATRTM